MLTCLFGSPWCVPRYNSLFSNFLTPGQWFVRWENPGKFLWVDTFSLGLLQKLLLTRLLIRKIMFIIWMHLHPQNVWSYYGALDTVGQVLNERRTGTTYHSKGSRDCLAGKQKYGRRRQDAPRVILFKTHLALFCLRRTLRYSDRRRHT